MLDLHSISIPTDPAEALAALDPDEIVGIDFVKGVRLRERVRGAKAPR